MLPLSLSHYIYKNKIEDITKETIQRYTHIEYVSCESRVLLKIKHALDFKCLVIYTDSRHKALSQFIYNNDLYKSTHSHTPLQPPGR